MLLAMDDRLTELELRYTRQQALLQELSDVLFTQQRELDALKLEVSALRSRLAGIEELPSIGPAERPPHF
jgi:SlyX protein